MPITAVDKVKINKYIKENKIGEIYYNEMCEIIGKKDKISDVEFLEYFTDCVLAEFRKNTKISSKYVAKIVRTVESFLKWSNEDGLVVSDEILDKIRSFREFYQEYLNRTNCVIDNELNDVYIKSVLDEVNKLFPNTEQNESVTIYINQITELGAEIKKLEKKLLDAQKQLENSQKTISQKQEKIENISNNLILVTNESNNKTREIEQLKKQIKELNSRIEELKKELSSAIEINSELLPFKEEFEKLTKEIERLKKIITDDEKQKEQVEKLIVKENKLEALIYETLLFNNQSIEELICIAKKAGITTNTNQVLELLKKMKTRINISNGGFSLKPKYIITPPHINENEEFAINLPYRCKYYDVMLVSDFHIVDFGTKTINAFNHLNEYCVKNGINLILNLGDFFEGFGSKNLKYENAIKNYQAIEEAIKLIPKVQGLYHAILGGNHDRNITNYGFDPIELLTREREDLINLGYNHSIISFNNPEQILGQFDIHHPDTFDFSISLNEDGLHTEEVENYLNNIYDRENRSRDNSYIDIFGHTHKSQLNYLNSYCFVPSYLKGTSKRGAIHLRIYFAEDKSIKYMVFMPLNHNSNLVKNNEIVYQKQLLR